MEDLITAQPTLAWHRVLQDRRETLGLTRTWASRDFALTFIASIVARSITPVLSMRWRAWNLLTARASVAS